MRVAECHSVVRGLFWSISCYAWCLMVVAYVWLLLLSCSFSRWERRAFNIGAMCPAAYGV